MDEVDVVRSVYERWASGDNAIDAFHPDVEWTTPHPGGQVRGREAVAAFLRELMGTWEGHTLEIEELRALGDGRVLALFTERGFGRGSGVPTESHPAAIWTLHDGLVTRFEAYGRDEGLARADALNDDGGP
jgi:ketosteroid isomerase-like protein